MSIEVDINQIKEALRADDQVKVRVALFGQPGAGKSSLINRLAGLRPPKAAPVGVETDKTVDEARYEHGDLFLHDLPGYGTQRFPADGFYERFALNEKDLFLCVISGKLHSGDVALFKELKIHGKVCLFVVNQCDSLYEDGKTTEELKQAKATDIRKYVGEDVSVHFASCRTSEGLDALTLAIRENLEGAKKERWERFAAAYSQETLDRKRNLAESMVTRYAALSAANSINPIPGANIAVDIGILVKLFKEIRESYGLSDEKVQSLAGAMANNPSMTQVLNNILQYATKEGVALLLKQFAGRELALNVARYVPFVGQAIAATLGFGITKMAGDQYLEDCHQAASAILKANTGYGSR
ncbi:MAG: GTPase [Bacteroidota bacterium]